MKYSYEEKLQAVLLVVSSYHSLTQVAKDLGTHPEHLRRWVKRYEEYGEEGLLMKRYTYSGDFKLSALRYMFENHLSLRQTAVKFGIPNESTLLNWEHIYNQEGEVALYRNNRGKMKKQKKPIQPRSAKTKAEELQAELEYLRAENAYLKKLKVLVEERIARERGNEQKPSKD